jgi:prepilin-type processing-associated H-X9-DG protein
MRAVLTLAAIGFVGLLACGGIVVGVVLPARESARRAVCSNNLYVVSLAMHNYHDVYRAFPPSVITDEDGRPMRSWRVAILPFIEQEALDDRYDCSESWDGPHNRAMHDISIATYRCPGDTRSTRVETSYVRVVDDAPGRGIQTAGGEPNESLGFWDIRDGTSRTIILIEVGSSGIHWMEPRDISLEEAFTFLTDPDASPFRRVHRGGVHVAFADGKVRFLPDSTKAPKIRAFLTANGEEPIYGEGLGHAY